MSDVVVDESVWVRALVAECTLDSDDLICVELMHGVQSRHRWVISLDILLAYYRQLNQTDCQGATRSGLTKSLKAVLVDSERVLWLEPPPPRVTGPFDSDDEHIVSAAAYVEGSILLTLDGRLIEALVAAGLSGAHRFRLMHPATAKL